MLGIGLDTNLSEAEAPWQPNMIQIRGEFGQNRAEELDTVYPLQYIDNYGPNYILILV